MCDGGVVNVTLKLSFRGAFSFSDEQCSPLQISHEKNNVGAGLRARPHSSLCPCGNLAEFPCSPAEQHDKHHLYLLLSYKTRTEKMFNREKVPKDYFHLSLQGV